MLRLLKRCCWVLLVAGAIQSASAFSLLGPANETYQIQTLGYDFDSDIGAPKNLGEEYRWSLPKIYYAFDQSFLDYFGSNGVRAVDQAILILTNYFNGVSAYSADLSEFPLEATRLNRRAQALGLVDVKSLTLSLLVEQLGLAEPDRYTWTLRNRVLPPGAACPDYEYTVIKRNFDPITFEPSSYVNGTLYTYSISEFCPVRDQAEAVELAVDPDANALTAVAAFGSAFSSSLGFSTAAGSVGFASYGSYYTGLTRDDAGGLRYLYRTNNVNREAAESSSLFFATNKLVSQILTTSNLAVFSSQALTNPPAALLALYPGLIILDSQISFVNVVQTNITANFGNYPFAPYGSPAILLFSTNLTTVIEPRYQYAFGNVVSNVVFSSGLVTIQEITIGLAPFAPVGSGVLATNVKNSTEVRDFVNGTFYILPTNSCAIQIVSTQLVNVVTVTNSFVTATNVVGTTNASGFTNQTFQAFAQTVITYLTNYNFLIHPVLCQTNALALRQGVDKIEFIRKDFDSLLSQFYEPFTNKYELRAVTNNRVVVQQFERVVTQPDILFTAADLVSPPGTFPIVYPFTARSVSFNATNSVAGLAGPGTIEPQFTITFNKVGPLNFHFNSFFITESSASQTFLWGSFDGTTNAPVVYPSGTSIVNLENLILNPSP